MQSEEHRQKVQEGARAFRAVRAYLEALEALQPRPGRSKKTADEIRIDLVRERAKLEKLEPIKRLKRYPKIDQLVNALKEREVEDEARAKLDELAEDFIQHAARYGESNGIAYEHWLEVRVPPEILAKAGIEPRN